MAADPEPDWISGLPCSWSYGVTRDGRVFFINEEAKSTAWLHPVTGETAATGHRKTPDLPTGWEEGYTFEGARCFINHNERKVTCKHPVSGAPSQDNCIFVVNEQPVSKSSSEQTSNDDKKERPTSTMSEASNYTGGSDYSTFPSSPVTTTTITTTTTSSTRPSRPSKKLHNFGKRSNSIKRNINAPVVKKHWLYKQDSTGMKLWKKRWFVLSDMCLFYYRDEKEDSILGSILLPSFHISMLSVDDHISKKYAFKATHPNMRTYYFCTDTAKEMETWMKVMTDAALVQTEPIRRVDKLKVDQRTPHELNNLLNHRNLTRPEIQNNERNREPVRQRSLSRAEDKKQKGAEKHECQKERESYTLQRDGERYSLRKDGVSYVLQKDGDKYVLHKDGERYLLRKDGDRYSLQKDGDVCAIHKDPETLASQNSDEKYNVIQMQGQKTLTQEQEKHLLAKERENYALQRLGDRHQDDGPYVPQKEVRRQLSLRETDRYCAVTDGKYGTLKEAKRYSALREGDRYATYREAEKYATIRQGGKHGLQWDVSGDRSHAKISSIKLQPAQAAAIAAAVSASRHTNPDPHNIVNGSGEQPGSFRAAEKEGGVTAGATRASGSVEDAETDISRMDMSRMESTQQLLQDNWKRSLETRVSDDESRSITFYQTLPRNMPSHRSQTVPRYPEGYRTLPRNSMMRPDSICSVAGLTPGSGLTSAEKRRSMRDDTMWQLYEWQQRQAFSRQSLALPPAAGHYGTLPVTKTTRHHSERAAVPSIATSPSHHGPLALYGTFSPPRQQLAHNPSPQAELASPVFLEDATLDRRQRPHLIKHGYAPPDRRSVSAAVASQSISPQSLQGKTPEELTLLLIKLRRQQAELNSLREHTVAQLMALGLEGPNAKTDVLSHHLQRNLIYLEKQKKENEPLIFTIHTMIENSAPRPQLYQQVTTEEYKEDSIIQRTEDVDTDTKLSRLCEQDKVVRMQEDKLQQLHREKHTLETALLSASQELNEQGGSAPAATQSLVQQRDVLQSGLLSTCRELSRVSAELDCSWSEYDRLESDVTLTKSNLLEQLEALGSPQTEPPSQRHIQIQKELWRIQDVMEALAKTKVQRSTDSSFPASRPLSSLQKNEAVAVPTLASFKEGECVPPRPPLPQYYESECSAHHAPPGARLPPPTYRHEDRKPACRNNGAHSQAPDYRLYKSEPELTTVKEEGDEVNTEDKTDMSVEAKEAAASKVPSYPMGIVPPRTKSPMNPPESSTIASYVTLRKTKKPESRFDRPRSAVDQMGFGEREVGRTRMSLEEQLERMRRNQEASSLREKKRETPSRSPSFNKDKPFPIPQNQVQAGGPPSDLDSALQQLKGSVLDESGTAATTHEMRHETSSQGESRPTVLVDLNTEHQHVETGNLQPSEEDQSREPDVTPSDNSHGTISPEPDVDQLEVTQTHEPETVREEKLEITSYKQLTTDDKHNNNNMLTPQTFTLVTSDM